MKKEIPSSVLKRAKKLCAISDDPTASTYEIEQALKVAHDILLPYGLTVEDILESLRRDLVTEVHRVQGRQRRSKWLNDLMTNIAWFTDTSYMFRTGYVVEYVFVGLLSQVQRAIFHAETLHQQIEYYGECRAPLHMRDIRVYKQGIVDRLEVTMEDLKLDRIPTDVVKPMVSTVQSMIPEGSAIMVLAPVKASKLADPQYRRGFRGVVIDGSFHEFTALPKIKAGQTVELVVGHTVRAEWAENRLVAGLRDAFNLSDKVYVLNQHTSERIPFEAKRQRRTRPSEEALIGLQQMIQSYLDDNSRGTRPPLLGSYAANYSPDYAVGYQHGAEIKIQDGIGQRWRR